MSTDVSIETTDEAEAAPAPIREFSVLISAAGPAGGDPDELGLELWSGGRGTSYAMRAYDARELAGSILAALDGPLVPTTPTPDASEAPTP